MKCPEGADNSRGELRIVDVVRHPDELAQRRLDHDILKRLEQGGVGVGIMKGLSPPIEQGHTALRQEEAHRPLHPVQPFADPPANPRVLLRRGPH
jgi:hypothetical protein